MKTSLLENCQAWPDMSETARILGLSKSTISKQARKGRIPTTPVGLGRGRRYIISPHVVLDLGDRYQISSRVIEERLAEVMAKRLRQDTSLIRRALRTSALTMRSQGGMIEDDHIEVQQNPDTREARGDVAGPAWMVAEIKKLDLDRLAGMIVLTSSDDIAGEVPYAHPHLGEMALATHDDFPDLIH